MDALQVLKSDHDTVRELFRQFEQAEESGDRSGQEKLSEQIFTELQVHTKIEEEIFYPAAKEVSEEAAELVAEGWEEHHVVDQIIGELQQLGPADESFSPKMKVLIENVEHHASEEEDELFPKLREKMGERLQTLGDELVQAKERHLGGTNGRSAAVEGMTKDELYEQAKQQGVEGRSGMTKDELKQAVDES